MQRAAEVTQEKGATMIETLHIRGYRSLYDVELTNLGQVNILLGAGNSGKTSLLEAVFLFCSNGDPTLLYKGLGLRRITLGSQTPEHTVTQLDWCQSRGTPSNGFTITGKWNSIDRHVEFQRLSMPHILRLRPDPPDGKPEQKALNGGPAFAGYTLLTRENEKTHLGQFFVTPTGFEGHAAGVQNLRGRFVPPIQEDPTLGLANTWSEVEARREKDKVLELLRTLDPGIMNIGVAADQANRAFLRLDHSAFGLMPLEAQGAGFAKALSLAGHTVAAEDGVLLADEFDASLHPGAQKRIVQFVLEAAHRHRVQLFIATHSLETLDHFLDGFDARKALWSRPDDLCVIQLKRIKDHTEAKRLDADSVRIRREELGLDLRHTS